MRNGMGKFLHMIRTNKNIPIYAAAVMLCLTLLSSHVVSGVYASYATGSQLIEGARVAKFSITGDGILSEPIAAELKPGGFETASLNIHNNSEVAVEYTINVANETDNLPLQLSLEKTGSSLSAQGADVTFTDQQLAGDHVDQYTLRIDWKAEDNASTLMGKVDYITVTVTAAQID